ncbi:hypothetical protein [Oceanivirga salmonicida]|uniref:hypothetical protein n=1 Tax=Oceanivirga salmonicida TaxID=1769291 RepID=UPI0008320BA0|nr:hypothetical protein [Oceanivirga salmonicida]
MKISNSIIVCYKKPTSYMVLDIMKENYLFDKSELLKNIEKVIPVSKILKNKKNKNIKNIIFDNKEDKLLFYLYF